MGSFRKRRWNSLTSLPELLGAGQRLDHDVAIKAYREGKLPFPDGTIIARLAWDYVPLEESGKAFGRLQSFVAGPPKNGVQFMVKDSRKYASTGGWGFAHFDDDKPADEAVYNTCFSCHAIVDQCGLSRLMHGEMPCSYGFDA